MHDYLRAIGFSQISQKKDLQRLLNMVMGSPEQEWETEKINNHSYGEKSKSFLKNAGITVRGEIDEMDVFNYEYYFPYFINHDASVTEHVTFEKMAEREDYDGFSDVVNLGVSLIFHMNRLEDYSKGRKAEEHASICLSALSISGKVILPIAKTESDRIRKSKESDARNNMIAAARRGDIEALESLTIEDIDLNTSIAKRVKHEDVLSIVESYFMPYGIACEQYSVMGEIIECEKLTNKISGEQVYQMKIECNDIFFDICINEKDLLGEPAEGRRFRGNIWLQGVLEK